MESMLPPAEAMDVATAPKALGGYFGSDHCHGEPGPDGRRGAFIDHLEIGLQTLLPCIEEDIAHGRLPFGHRDEDAKAEAVAKDDLLDVIQRAATLGQHLHQPGGDARPVEA